MDMPRIGALGHPLTREQERIIAQPPTETFKCMAYAGCAKTTTSVEYAHVHPETALYLAFNAAIAGDAKGRFPRHVHTQTAHGYAYNQMGVRQHDDRRVQRLRPESLNGLGLKPMSGMTELAVRRAVLKSLNAFIISGDERVTDRHVTGFPWASRGAAVAIVQRVAERMLDFERSGLPFTHDIYLKAFAQRGLISPHFDYLIVDEAQDLNPVLVQIVKSAKRPAIVVGDPWQSIYLFRGAVQAMDHFQGPRYSLSQSFRFGPRVAAVANHVLKQSTNPPDTPIQGNPTKDTKVQEYTGSVKGRATILARTNMRLFESLVKITGTFHVVGGIEEMIDQATAGHELWRQRSAERVDRSRIRNPLVARHNTWADLVESSELDEDPETIRLVKIIDGFGDKVPDILADLRRRHRSNEDEARFIVSTAHKAKGREWDHVVVLDDFPTMFKLRQWLGRKRIERHEYDQEINLLYVTMTRAIETLSISTDLYDEIASGTGLIRY